MRSSTRMPLPGVSSTMEGIAFAPERVGATLRTVIVIDSCSASTPPLAVPASSCTVQVKVPMAPCTPVPALNFMPWSWASV